MRAPRGQESKSAVNVQQGNVTKLRRLLSAAEPAHDERPALDYGLGPEAQRRLLKLEVRWLVTTYWLRASLDGFLARTDAADLGSLSTTQLQSLIVHLRKAAERVEYACDDARCPPAR